MEVNYDVVVRDSLEGLLKVCLSKDNGVGVRLVNVRMNEVK